MIVKTGRFGQLTLEASEVISFPQGLLGFPDLRKFCLVDPGDDTLILWLQSLENPEIAFAVLEPKVFKLDYIVRLSGTELRELELQTVSQSAVFSVLTIPDDVSQMTANIKAPIVINLKDQIGRQVVLQENEYSLKHPMFKELRAHLATIEAQKRTQTQTAAKEAQEKGSAPVSIRLIPPSSTVRSLHQA